MAKKKKGGKKVHVNKYANMSKAPAAPTGNAIVSLDRGPQLSNKERRRQAAQRHRETAQAAQQEEATPRPLTQEEVALIANASPTGRTVERMSVEDWQKKRRQEEERRLQRERGRYSY